MAPEVLEFKNQIYLFYQRINSNHGFDIFCCRSSDGLHFSINNEKRIFSESNNLSAFDAVSVSTVRIWREENWFFMVYGGGNKFRDYPLAFGLARSRDLLNWERYPHNPILLRGKPGNWDEGAVWFGTVYKHKGTYYLWYEGTGTGLPLTNANAIEKSRQCREEDYGGYGINSFSQIGLATFAGDIAKWD
jgi:beta-xylosidase